MYKDGHIPFAKSFLFAKCIDNEKKVMKTPAEMQKVFEEHGVDLSQPLVATCALAISGAFVLFGSYLAGKTDTRLYDGAWAEFGQRAPKEMIEKWTVKNQFVLDFVSDCINNYVILQLWNFYERCLS